MKRWLGSVAMLGALLLTGRASAQQDAPPALPTRILSLNPLGLALGFYSLEYEQAVHERVSVFVQPGYTPHLGSSDTIPLSSGPYLSSGARFFLLGEAPTGLFVASGIQVHVPMGVGVDDRFYVRGNATRLGADLLVGGAWQSEWLYLSAGLGALYSVQPFYIALNRVLLPTVRANVGVAF